MTIDRFDNYHYRKIKPGNHGMIKGFILALSIHGVLFFIGGKYFTRPVQYSVQSDTVSIDVDLVTAVSQSDTESVQPITSAAEKQQELIKTVLHEEPVIPVQPEVDTVKPITPTTEEQQESVKIIPQEEQVTLPQPNVDAAQSITSATEKQQETAKTMPRPSQGTIRTKSKPGYFQNRPPEYPQLAKQMRQEGLVILRVEVDQKGMPVKVEVEQSSGYQLLDQAALKAVRHWRFQPERIGNSPVKSMVAIPVRFRLEESGRRSN
ncbi:MAG: energy transducer TonB [Candidatus Brocadia sp.]|nr:energy transducer TonB [Candidatus Brocadia sp.]UJS18533.1 MAG: energy transducer TonB [Candidatus Jettenia sp.]